MNPTDLRVVGGELKGRKFESPKSNLTHPMGSREKLALFNMIADKVKDAKVLDTYAGSGALGIEALSRGAKEVIFVEAYRPTAITLVRNLRNLGLKGEIYTGTVAKFVDHYIHRPLIMDLNKNQNRAGANAMSGSPSSMWMEAEDNLPMTNMTTTRLERFDIIFADPPYSYFNLPEVELLVQLLETDGIFVLSYPSEMKVPEIKELTLSTNHVYSRAGIAIYRKA